MRAAVSDLVKSEQAITDDWSRSLFARVDARDTDGWLAYFCNVARFCFGNAPPLMGNDAIRIGVDAFFSSLSAIRDDIVEVWTSSDAVICRGGVTDTRPEGSTLSVLFANVFKLKVNGLVREHLIYGDISKL